MAMYGGNKTRVMIRFCDTKDFPTFTTSIDAINNTARLQLANDLGLNTDIVHALKVAMYEMFSQNSGSRIGVPKTLIIVTDGDCHKCAPGPLFNSSYKAILDELVGDYKS